MTIGMKIPRGNIYLKSGFPFFAKDSFQAPSRARHLHTGPIPREITSTTLMFSSYFLLQPGNYCFPKLPVYSAAYFFIARPSSSKMVASVRARARFPLWKVGDLRPLSGHVHGKWILIGHRSLVNKRFVTDSRTVTFSTGIRSISSRCVTLWSWLYGSLHSRFYCVLL